MNWYKVAKTCKFASMDVYVVDHTYDQEVDNILHLCFALSHDFFTLLSKILTNEEMEHWKQNRPMEVLAPDGYSWDKPSGVMNFYIVGLPESKLPKIVSMLKYILGEKGVKFGDLIYEKSGIFDSNVVRFPIIELPSQEINNPPKMHLSNANMRFLFEDLLGLNLDQHSFDTWQISQKIDLARSTLKNKLQEENRERKEMSGGNVHVMLVQDDQALSYLDRLQSVCDWATENGYVKIGVG